MKPRSDHRQVKPASESSKRGANHRPILPSSPTAAGARFASINPKWSWHYRTLLALRDRLGRDTTVKLHEAAEPLEPHSLHAGDSATDEFDHDLALTLLSAEQHALNDVNDAIVRIEQGTYGICEASKAPIPAARLRALPWCRYTREVEEQLERVGSVPRTRLPGVVSLRGGKPVIPAEGDLPREGAAEEEEVEPEEITSAKIITERSSVAGAMSEGSEAGFEGERPPGEET